MHMQPMVAIAEQLNLDGVESCYKAGWDASTVCKILSNEKYMGDIMLMKKITVDHITHRQIKNDHTVYQL